MVGWSGGDRLSGVVLVKGQRDALAAGLRLDIPDRVTIFLADVGIERVAVFILGRRVPGPALRQVLLADVLLLTRSDEGAGIDAGVARRRHPLGRCRGQTEVRAVEGACMVGDRVPSAVGRVLEAPR